MTVVVSTPEVVAIEVEVAVSIIGGLTTIEYTRAVVAPAASVAVTVSVMVRAAVVLVDVRVLATLSVNAFAVDVSIVTPALALVIENDLLPVP